MPESVRPRANHSEDSDRESKYERLNEKVVMLAKYRTMTFGLPPGYRVRWYPDLVTL